MCKTPFWRPTSVWESLAVLPPVETDPVDKSSVCPVTLNSFAPKLVEYTVVLTTWKGNIRGEILIRSAGWDTVSTTYMVLKNGRQRRIVGTT